MHNIKAVVFDFGGVIESSHSNAVPIICKILDISRDKWNQVYFEYNHLTNINGFTWSECALLVSEKLGANHEQLQEIKKIINDSEMNFHLNLELVEIIKKIKNLDYKIAVLSNYVSGNDLNKKLDNYKIREFFDEVVVSGDVGFQKPDPNVFKVLFDKLNVKPKEVVFVDDARMSLSTAKEVGYIPILFKDNISLKKELKKLLKIHFN